MPNIEIKAVYPNLERARKIARGLKARFIRRERQVDSYFTTHKGRLKLRETSKNQAELIPYFRPNQKGPKQCNYAVIPVADSGKTKALFQRLLGIDAVVDKKRDIFLYGNVRIHLDRVKGLGNFLEFEAVYKVDSPGNRAKEIAKVKKLLEIFEVQPKFLLKNSYRELIRKKKFPRMILR